MRSKIVFIIVASSFLIAASLTVDAKPVKKAKVVITNKLSGTTELKVSGLINGKQYLVLGGGAKAISDNQIYYISCDSNDCDRIYDTTQSYYSKFNDEWNIYKKKRNSIVMELGSCAALERYEHCEKKMRQELSYLGRSPVAGEQYLDDKFKDLFQVSNLTHTDFEGNYSIDCPTSKCLIFSTGLAGNAKGYWVKVINSNSKFDLANSTSIHSYDITKFRDLRK